MVFDAKLKILENGDMESIATYPQREVEVKVRGQNIVIGHQPEYGVKNIIKKDQLPVLYEYLVEQKNMLLDRIKKAKEVIEETREYYVDGLMDEFKKLPKDKIKSKHTQALSKYAGNVTMYIEAKKTVENIQKNLETFDYQIDFIEKELQK